MSKEFDLAIDLMERFDELRSENQTLRAKLANCIDAIDELKRDVAELKRLETDGK